MLAARELSYAQVPEKAKTWVNQRLKYTHGYGVVMSPVNRVAANGLPDFYIKDIPPVSNIDISIKRPEIYYGEETNDYIFTGTSTKEFDYPLGDQNKFSQYEGDKGVPLHSLFRKIVYSLHFKSIKILISNYLTSKTKVHYHRNILDRVYKIAPFLSYDNDPYIVISDGRLYWIIDAYTRSNFYPYAQPIQNGNFNYLRNSVKVIVDAYNGSVDFVVVDEKDPLLKTYRKIFPDLFKNKDSIASDLIKHFRYPQDLFKVQAQIYTSYHMNNSNVFYNKEDMWKLPTEIYENIEQPMEPYYIIMKLPESKQEEFVLILPFTPVNKKNMISWMAASSDGDKYGKLLLYEFPKKELVYGPMQIEARIDQEPKISEVLTLWNQKGSSVIRGNLLTIPIGGNLLYIEPLYLKAEQSQMPELKRVIAAYKNKIVMRESLRESLSAIFNEDLPTGSSAEYLIYGWKGKFIK